MGSNVRTTQDGTEISEQGALDGQITDLELVNDGDDGAPTTKHNYPVPTRG